MFDLLLDGKTVGVGHLFFKVIHGRVASRTKK